MSTPSLRRRRGFLSAGLASLVAWVIGKTPGAAEAAPAGAEDDVVRKHMKVGNPPFQPLDTMMLFERGSDAKDSSGGTREVLSLIQEEKAQHVYPWTLYASLDTHHEMGDGCVVCSRLHKHGPGWATGLHSEVYSHARAVGIGVNIEMSCDYVGTEETHMIGMNIQAVGGPRLMQYGIQIHDNESGAAHFETAIGLKGKSKTGIDLSGTFDVGIHTHGNNIRLSEGSCIELDDKGEVKIRYREGKIEFLKGNKRVASIDMSGADRAL